MAENEVKPVKQVKSNASVNEINARSEGAPSGVPLGEEHAAQAPHGELPSEESIVTEAAAPNTTASNAAAAVLPDIPMTSRTGGSPFGEASVYEPPDGEPHQD